MATIVRLHIRDSSPAEEVDLDTLTPRARALAEAISMSFGQQPLGVLCDTDRTKGENPQFAYRYGTGPQAEAIAAQPDRRFLTHLTPIRQDSPRSPEQWLEANARDIPLDYWPIAGAHSRMRPLEERVPSADAAREDRCLTRDQALPYLADKSERTIILSPDAWILLQKAGNIPGPRHYAVGGLMPLWHVDDLDAYIARDYERWTVSQVAEYLGYSGPSATGSARRQLSRWELAPVDRQPGRAGENRYAADQVQAAHRARPGKGRHGAERAGGGRFTASDSTAAETSEESA
ncbi:hypothetical protein [Streptomyces silvensis]|uniref:Uncharacterized protein n=1 Tax=Streptomyces silvensis TaxID=1765722 RepID=A0A0W7X3X4_9ACTN|nr:hypothetical protein [Streptomyces silvensis]KUF17378.1 hypothetical protein AT728_16385 [Streptomyces silvensis]